MQTFHLDYRQFPCQTRNSLIINNGTIKSVHFWTLMMYENGQKKVDCFFLKYCFFFFETYASRETNRPQPVSRQDVAYLYIGFCFKFNLYDNLLQKSFYANMWRNYLALVLVVASIRWMCGCMGIRFIREVSSLPSTFITAWSFPFITMVASIYLASIVSLFTVITELIPPPEYL